MNISSELNGYRLQGVVDWLLLGPAPARIKVYSGDQPAFGAAPAGDLLLIVEFAEPIGTISNGVLQLTPTPESQILISGTASWARVENGAGAIGFDVPVSDIGGSAPFKLQTTQLYAGGYGRIVSGTLV